jgi:hypothetical protein
LNIAGFEELVSADSTWRFKIEGDVPIDSHNEKFILIFTTEELMRKAIPYKRPITFPTGKPMGIETAVIRYPAVGRLSMEVVPYSVENTMTFDLQSQRQVAESLVDDGVIEPGKRIGRLRLGGKLHEVTKRVGKGEVLGPGDLYRNSTLYNWENIGLRLIANNDTGDLLWISVSTAPANPWSEVSTSTGVRLGSTEHEVLSAMGQPSATFADTYNKSIYYEGKGIIFIIPSTGRFKEKVGSICILRP